MSKITNDGLTRSPYGESGRQMAKKIGAEDRLYSPDGRRGWRRGLTLFSLSSLSLHSCSASLLYTIIPFIQYQYSYSYWVNVDLLSVSDTPVSGVLCD